MSSTKIRCGTQCLICDYPIHFDTYYGCSHNCRYCFADNKNQLSNIKPQNQVNNIKRFIEDKRTVETNFCDWNIPLHWGANSDPFQKCEYQYQKSLECLKIFAETQYPFIVSTKNPCMLLEEPYFDLIKKCNVVLQISMVCGRYDKIEKGAPKYEERLKAMAKLTDNVKRIIIRVQPYFVDCFVDVINEIPKYKINGAYGIVIEGYCSFKKNDKIKHLQHLGKKFDYPVEILAPQYKYIKEICHKNNLKFFCGEERLRFLGDDLSCCGTMGLDDFIPNKYNVEHLAHDKINAIPTKSMLENDCSQPLKSFRQTTAWAHEIKGMNFEGLTHKLGDYYIDWYSDLRKEWE